MRVVPVGFVLFPVAVYFFFLPASERFLRQLPSWFRARGATPPPLVFTCGTFPALRSAISRVPPASFTPQRQAPSQVLTATLFVDDYIDLDALKNRPVIPPFSPGALETAAPRPSKPDYEVPPLSGLQRFVPGATSRHAQAVTEAAARYELNVAEWDKAELKRL